MSNEAWEALSNQAVGAAGIVYFAALLVHLAEWASLRGAKEPAAVASGSAGGVAVATPPAESEPDAARRVAFLGRLGVLLTGVAAAAHLVSLVGRGIAADPNRVPWGNMYEFTLSGTFVISVMYLALHR